jgi:uncharacterized protein (TIGR00299 family) protein
MIRGSMARELLLHADGAAGIAGDMTLGAIVDLGVPVERLREGLATLDVPGWSIRAERVVSHGLAATRVVVEVEGGHHDHVVGGMDESGHAPGGMNPAHTHDDHHHGRTFAEIANVIERSRLPASVRGRATDVFRKLCAAEAEVHGVAFERVHLHEAGAVDALVDICGTCLGLELLGSPELSCSPPELGSGSVNCKHGVIPIPGPATLRLLANRPVRSSTVDAELTTPTGAALLATLSTRWGSLPDMTVERIGYGAGTRTLPDRANVLRLTLGRRAQDAEAEPGSGDHAVIEADLDDADPQLLAAFAERARALGAADVTQSPLAMKKGRSGIRLTVVAPVGARERLVDALFEETTTIGCRWHVVRREECEREVRSVATPWGPVRVKVARWKGRIVNRKPEHDDCAALAAGAGVPLKDVAEAARAAAAELRS